MAYVLTENDLHEISRRHKIVREGTIYYDGKYVDLIKKYHSSTEDKQTDYCFRQQCWHNCCLCDTIPIESDTVKFV